MGQNTGQRSTTNHAARVRVAALRRCAEACDPPDKYHVCTTLTKNQRACYTDHFTTLKIDTCTPKKHSLPKTPDSVCTTITTHSNDPKQTNDDNTTLSLRPKSVQNTCIPHSCSSSSTASCTPSNLFVLLPRPCYSSPHY